MSDEPLWWHGDAQNTSHEPESDDEGGANASEVEGRPETKYDMLLAGLGLLVIVYILYRRYRNKRRRRNPSGNPGTEGTSTANVDPAASPQRLTQREKRKEWYLQYLSPYTMSVTDTDFVTRDEDLEKAESTSGTTSQFSSSEDLSSRDATEAADETSSSSHDGDSNNMMDLEAQKQYSSPTEQENMGVRLPKDTNAPAGTTRRVVDAECAICVSTYEKGDLLVWSGLEDCPHAFHHECILEWLCKGKKRCPICRHWFVPGAPIEAQRKQWELEQATSATTTPTDIASPVTDLEHQEVNNHSDQQAEEEENHHEEGSDLSGPQEENATQT